MSTLPFWIVTNLGRGKAGIECPRKSCGGKAIVNLKKWLGYKDADDRSYIGRSCTYCFKTNRLPEE